MWVSLYILLTGNHGQQKKDIKWFSQNAKDCESKDDFRQPFYLLMQRTVDYSHCFQWEKFFLSSKIRASHFTTEYNFKHAKSGSSQNCECIIQNNGQS
jgi:hypothetical protein